MSVLDLCDSDVASVRVEVSAADAIRLMLDRHVGAVGVIDNAGLVAGIFYRARRIAQAVPYRPRPRSDAGAGTDDHSGRTGDDSLPGRVKPWRSCWNAIFAISR